MKQAQLKHPIVIMMEPLIECLRVTPLFWFSWLLLPCVHGRPISGPLTNVMIIAPATVAIVPTILAWLRMLINCTFSSLEYIGTFNDLT